MEKNQIIFYSTGCPKCNILKKKLQEKNISYELNTNVEEMLSLGISEVPVLSINGKLMDFKTAIEWIKQFN